MEKMNRRKSLKYLGLGSLAAGSGIGLIDAEPALAQMVPNPAPGHDHGNKTINQQDEDRDKKLMEQKFFTDEEFEMVKKLANIIIPKDERSGSASDAGVPEFIQFMMADQPYRQTPMRGGLQWLNQQCLKRFNKSFNETAEAEYKQVLDDIAWPAKAKPSMGPGVAFFNNFRDLVASGFWTSRMGIDDLRYLGNVGNPNWNGCPDEALIKLGVISKTAKGNKRG